MPTFNEKEIRDYFPALEAVFYAAGTVKYFAEPFMKSGVKIFSAAKANGVPVAEFTASQIILANKGYFQAQNPDGVVYAVASRTIEKAQKYASRHGNCIAYRKYEDMVADANIDVIYIATPTINHYENIKMCLVSGKNVICEKPITSSASELNELKKLAIGIQGEIALTKKIGKLERVRAPQLKKRIC